MASRVQPRNSVCILYWWQQHAMMLRRRLQASKQGQNQWLSSDGNDTEPSETLNNVQGDIITLV